MILNDFLSEYKYVHNTLSECGDYFIICNQVINDFFSMISEATGSFSKKINPIDGERKNYISKLENTYQKTYKSISQMVRLSYPLYGAMAKLDERHFKIPALISSTKDFVSCGRKVIDATTAILIEGELGMESNVLLPQLISPLCELMQKYYSLQQHYIQFKGLDEMLFEDLPNNISSSQKYNRIELRSLMPMLSMDSFATDINNLSSFIHQFELIMDTEGGSRKIFVQRIESGSLRIVFGSNFIELSSISDIIKALFDGIRKVQAGSSEKKLKKEKNRELKIQNDEKELAIINSQIETIARYLNLSPDNPEDAERIQKLCFPLLRYIYNNPVGMIDDYTYDLNNDLKLIGSVFDTKQP